jgi:hypothetical protein
VCLSLFLKVSYTNTVTLAYADHGTGSAKDLSIWTPALPTGETNEWFSVGHLSVNGYSTPNDNFGIVQADSATDVAEPVEMTRNWNDVSSGGAKDGALYTPTCPTGFVPLGSVAIYLSDKTAAKPSDFPGLRCIASKFTMPYKGAALTEVWDCKAGSAGKCRGKYSVSRHLSVHICLLIRFAVHCAGVGLETAHAQQQHRNALRGRQRLRCPCHHRALHD